MYRCLGVFPALFILAAAPAPRATPVARSTPVMLTQQPGSAMDKAARLLSAADLAEAKRAGEVPLVLVGLGKLSAAAGDRAALFVQLQSSRECGSAGCNTSVYLWRKGAYARVLDGVGGKLSIATARTRGMSDLLTETERYIWSGTEYRDANPAPQVDLRPRGKR